MNEFLSKVSEAYVGNKRIKTGVAARVFSSALGQRNDVRRGRRRKEVRGRWRESAAGA